MNPNLMNTLMLAAAYLMLFALGELLYHKFKVEAEKTRKLVHVVTGLLTMLFPVMLGNHWYVLLLCSSFLLILLVSQRFSLLPSINAVNRVTRGSILYPIVVYSCFLIYQHYDQLMLYYLPILTLAICDPIAALVGMKWPFKPYVIFGHKKTISGSAAFFFSSLILSVLLILSLEQIPWSSAVVIALLVAVTTTVAEAISQKGYDNLTIPLSALIPLVVFNELYLV